MSARLDSASAPVIRTTSPRGRVPAAALALGLILAAVLGIAASCAPEQLPQFGLAGAVRLAQPR